MRPMKPIPLILVSIFLLARLVVGQAQKEAAASNEQQETSHNGGHQPAPEPYSFSYSSESVGGQSTHQESGDGSGRVSGFYTIMGEDGRERRVDYVADENGYRASVSTNEVGTRSESSADAQFNARLPSDKQLEQAKVTAQEYQYLEETHAAERERQLARLSSKEQNFQQNSQWSSGNAQSQQQRLQPQQQQQQQPSWSIGSQRQQSGGLSVSSSSFGGGQQQQSGQQQSNQPSRFNQQFGPNQFNQATNNQQLAGNQQVQGGSSFSTSTEGASANFGSTSQSNDADWRQRSNFTGNFQTGGQGASWMQRFTSDNNQQQQQSVNRQQQQQPQAAASTESTDSVQGDVTQSVLQTSTGSSFNAAGQQQQSFVPSTSVNAGPQQQPQQIQPQSQRPDGVQQFQQAAWMMTNRGGVPTRRPTTLLQKQLETQFMQQAQQLTDQDYPRQAGNQQYQDRYNQQFNSNSNNNNNNNNIGQQIVSNNQRGSELNQINQQQTNIIDEIGDQIDQQVGVDQQVNVVGGGGTTTATQTFSTQPQRTKTINYEGQTTLITTTNRPNLNTLTQQQQAKLPTQASTFNQSVPPGFVSITLNNNNNNRPFANQFQEQEVDARPYSTVAPNQQTTQFGYNQFVNQSTSTDGQQALDVQTDTGDIQQVTAGAGPSQQLEEISTRPESIKQIIEQQRQQGTKQQQQQQQFTRPTVSVFSRPIPTTTTTTTTTAPVAVYQTTPSPIFVETTRAPVFVLETTTPKQVVYVQPSTTTSTQTPVAIENQTVDYRPIVSTTVDTTEVTSNLPTRRPQQQLIAGNIKGGSQYIRQQNTRYNPRPINNTFVDNKGPNRETFNFQRSNVSSTFSNSQRPSSTNYYNEGQKTTYSTEASREIPKVPAQFEAQTDLQRQPVQSPYGLPQQQQQQQQQPQIVYQPRQPLSNIQTNVTRPSKIEYQQQQQQPLKGTKGGSSSRANKRQFWLNQQQQQPLGGRNLTTSGSNSNNFQSNSLVGVDYANTDFGSRVAARLR